MKKNWFAMPLEELIERKDKLMNWIVEYPKHEKQKEAREVTDELCAVIDIKQRGESDPFIKLLSETVC